MNFTNTQDVISYLYSLPKFHEKADLSYIKRTLAALHNPQDKVKTVHVTGTNGKGSTCYYLSNLLQKAGQKTGLFVSPYVFEFNERIQLNGQNISDDRLIDLANQIEKVLSKIRQTEPDFALATFEYEVAMAFLYFAQEKCDFAVIEVGIGGEHDKTNVITPEVSIITTVGLDHEQIIGPTLKDIAREKSGIIKKNRPVVLGDIPEEVLPIILAKANDENAPVKLWNKNFRMETEQNKDMIYRDGNSTLSFTARPRVEGIDISVAVQAFKLLNLKLTDLQIERAINETVIPGRYQILATKPLIILDGAHNIQAMKNLLTFAHEQQQKRHGTIRILIMMMKDKDLTEVFALFKPTDRVMLTTIDYPRAAKEADFPPEVREKYEYNSDWQKTYTQMRQASQANDILLVTGSFYLVGNILQMEEKNEDRKQH